MASGTKLVLPMVVLNMGGEMVNILHQRLNAQEVGNDKQDAVLHDVIRTMYAPKVRVTASSTTPRTCNIITVYRWTIIMHAVCWTYDMIRQLFSYLCVSTAVHKNAHVKLARKIPGGNNSC